MESSLLKGPPLDGASCIPLASHHLCARVYQESFCGDGRTTTDSLQRHSSKGINIDNIDIKTSVEANDVLLYWNAALALSREDCERLESDTSDDILQRFEWASPQRRLVLVFGAVLQFAKDPQSHRILDLLRNSAYLDLINNILPVVALCMDRTSIPKLLGATVLTPLAAGHISNLCSVSPSLFSVSMHFLLDKLHDSQKNGDVAFFRYRSILHAVAKASPDIARMIPSHLARQRHSSVVENELYCKLFCWVCKEIYSPGDTTVALYDALFPKHVQYNMLCSEDACLYCSSELRRSHWLLSTVVDEDAVWLTTTVCNFLDVSMKNALKMSGNICEDLGSCLTSVQQLKRCATLLPILLVSLQVNLTLQKFIKSARSATCDTLCSMMATISTSIANERGAEFQVFQNYLTLARILLGALLLLVGHDIENETRAIAKSIELFQQILLILGDLAPGRFNTETYFLFFIRSAISLQDGAAIARAAMECVRPQDDFVGRVIAVKNSNNVRYSHLCECFENSKKETVESHSLELSREMCMSIQKKLSTESRINQGEILAEYKVLSELPRNEESTLPPVGDEIWCVGLLLSHARTLRKVSDEGSWTGFLSVYEHRGLLSLIHCSGDRPHHRVLHAIDKWHSLYRKRAPKAADMPFAYSLLRHELDELVARAATCKVSLNSIGASTEQEIHNAVILFSNGHRPHVIGCGDKEASSRSVSYHDSILNIPVDAFASVIQIDEKQEVFLSRVHASFIVHKLFEVTNELTPRYHLTLAERESMWSLSLATYAAASYSCYCRYKVPVAAITTSEEHMPVVPVLSEDAFETIEWSHIPVLKILVFLVSEVLFSDLILCSDLPLRLLIGLASMILRLCPDSLLLSPWGNLYNYQIMDFENSTFSILSKSDKIAMRKHLFQCAYKFRFIKSADSVYATLAPLKTLRQLIAIQHFAESKVTYLPEISESVPPKLIAELLSTEEMTILGIFCIQNSLVFEHVMKTRATEDCNVKDRNYYDFWCLLWLSIHKTHEAPRSFELASLNFMLDICKDFVRDPEGEEIISVVLAFNPGSVDSIVEQNCDAIVDDILNCDLSANIRYHGFNQFLKDPISLLRLLPPNLLRNFALPRILTFLVLSKVMVASRVLARRAVWSLMYSSRENDLQDTDRTTRCNTMHESFINLQDVIVCKLSLEIVSCSTPTLASMSSDLSVCSMRSLYRMNPAMLPLTFFYFDEYLTSRHVETVVRGDNFMLSKFGRYVYIIFNELVHGNRENGDIDHVKLLLQINDIKIASLGPMNWCCTLFLTFEAYLQEFGTAIKDDPSSRMLLISECDSIIDLFGPVLFKCCLSMSSFHKLDLLLSCARRAYVALVLYRPEMAALPLLELNELHFLKRCGNQRDYYSLLNGFTSSEPSCPSLSYGASKAYAEMKNMASEVLMSLQGLYNDCARGVNASISVDSFPPSIFLPNKRRMSQVHDEPDYRQLKKKKLNDVSIAAYDDVNEDISSGDSSSESRSNDSGEPDDRSGNEDDSVSSEDEDDSQQQSEQSSEDEIFPSPPYI